MITAKRPQQRKPTAVRVFLVYSDFKVRVDENSPVHFDVGVRKEDAQGINWLLMFRMFALDRREG